MVECKNKFLTCIELKTRTNYDERQGPMYEEYFPTKSTNDADSS